MRSKLAGCYSDHQFALAREIMPHMYRAVKTYNMLGTIGALHRASLDALDHLPLAAIIVDRKATVLYSNTRADVIIKRSDGLTINAESRLETMSQIQTNELDKMIGNSSTISRLSQSEAGNTTKISRIGTEVCYEVQVSPLVAEDYIGLTNPPRALILISDPLDMATLPQQSLVDLYGLTPTEAKITSLIVKGTSVQNIAVELSISVYTVRQHLKGVFRKTATASQSDLVRLVLSGTTPFGRKV